MGKAHKKAKGVKSIAKKGSIKDPGDLIHMDQAESTNPGRPLTHNGRDSTKWVTIFVNSISHKVYAEIQQSTGAVGTVASRNEVKYMQRHVESTSKLSELTTAFLNLKN